MKAKGISKRLATFEGAYLSGFFMTKPAMVTAMALLFEKIYLPNQLELVIEISKKYRIETKIDKDFRLKFEKIEPDGQIIIEDPLTGLSAIEQKTAHQYLMLAHEFCVRNHELFPAIFETDLLKKNEVFDVELVEKGVGKNLNKYNVRMNPLQVTTDGIGELMKRLRRGSVPLLGMGELQLETFSMKEIPDKSIAALIAMQSMELILPATKGVKPDVLLEARDKLSDHLPSFWSAMLKFSKEGRKVIKECATVEEAVNECRNLVDTSIRPILIDLNEKIIKERKNWFYKILSPVGNKLKLIIGKPNLTNLDLLSTSISLATEVGVDYVQHKRKLIELSQEAGLTYLIKLGQKLS